MTVTISYGQWWQTIASVTKKLNVTKGGVTESMCCGDIQGPSWILIIMTDSDRHHFIWTTTIFCDGPFMAVTIGAYIWRRSLTVTINSLVTSRSVTNIDYNDKQWPSPFHINNNYLWWRTFNGHHYWCVYMVAFVDRHHFIFWWGSKNVTISSLVMVKRASVTKNCSSSFPIYEYQRTMESNHQPPACKAGALPLS